MPDIRKNSFSVPSCKFHSGLRVGIVALLPLAVLLFVCYKILVLEEQVRQHDDTIRSLQDVTEQLLSQAAGDKRRIEKMKRVVQTLKEEVRV